MNKEKYIILSDAPKIKWVVDEKEKALERGISLVEFDTDKTFLSVSIKHVPENMSILEWIERALKTGIIAIDDRYA